MRIKNKMLLASMIALAGLLLWDGLTPSPYGDFIKDPSEWNLSMSNLDVNAIIQTFTSAIIGFIFTIIGVEIILNEQKKKEEKEKKRLQLNIVMASFNSVFQRTTSIINSSIHEIGEMPKDNSIPEIVTPEMCLHVYDPCLLATTPSFSTNLDNLELCLDELKQWLMQLATNPYVNEHFELAEIINGYYCKLVYYNPCKLLKESLKTGSNNEKTVDFIKRELPTADEKNIKKPSSVFYPIWLLKEIVDYHRDFWNKLIELDKEINK